MRNGTELIEDQGLLQYCPDVNAANMSTLASQLNVLANTDHEADYLQQLKSFSLFAVASSKEQQAFVQAEHNVDDAELQVQLVPEDAEDEDHEEAAADLLKAQEKLVNAKTALQKATTMNPPPSGLKQSLAIVLTSLSTQLFLACPTSDEYFKAGQY